MDYKMIKNMLFTKYFKNKIKKQRNLETKLSKTQSQSLTRHTPRVLPNCNARKLANSLWALRAKRSNPVQQGSCVTTGLPRAKALAVTNIMNCFSPRHCEHSKNAWQSTLTDLCAPNGLPRSFHSLAVTNTKNLCYGTSLREKRSFSWQSISGITKRVAFSLVEILVALIIVSVIMAALAPVITKKLSSAGITIVGGGSGGGGGAVDGDISKSVCKSGTYWDEGFQGCKICSHKTPHCEDCNTNTGVCSVCADGYELNAENQCEESGEVSCGEHALKIVLNGFEYCMTKYNPGDKNELPIANTVKTVTPGTNCPSSGTTMCCWTAGTTSSSCTSTNGDYSGCKRTVCDWRAANEICNKLEYQNLGWRLPKDTELSYLASSLAEYSTGKGNNGLMLCDGSNVTGISRCAYHDTNCKGAAEADCDPNYLWTSTSYKFFSLSGGSLTGPAGDGQNWAKSTRCIAPLVICNSGYYSNKDTLSCSTCDSLTPNCKTCHKRTGICNTCKDGYKLNEYKQCIAEDDPCGKHALKINLNGRDYCMTKYNIGDKNELPLSPKVTAAAPGANCPSSTTTFCCWSGGKTSGNCNSVNGDYSGCNRTVCDWRAAYENCLKLSYQGLAWRLPTDTELSSLGSVIYTYSAGKGNAGLMLCDGTDAYNVNGSSSRCTYHDTNCPGAEEADCDVNYLWTSTSYKYFALSGNVLTGPSGDGKNWAKSTRCIAPLVECGAGTYSDIDNFNCKPCENKTANCAECHKRNGTCTKCKAGYKLDSHNMCLTEDDPCGEHAMKVNLGNQDYCMLKYNPGDKNELKIPNTVKIVAPGSTCSSSGTSMCCWSGGKTASSCNSANGEYSGCNRTVCDWRAANEICNKMDYQDLDWRLPTNNEWSALGSKVFQYSVGKENSGLMLCDSTTAYSTSGSSSQCSYHDTNCPGAESADCDPNYIWSSASYQYFALSGISLTGPVGDGKNWAKSTRCIAPLINCVDGYYSNITKMECESCSIKTPNCKKCHKRNGTCTECKSGYHLDKYNMCVKDDDPCGDYSMKVTLNGQDYCMTKYNIGDKNELPIPGTVQVSAPGANCPSSSTVMCCWTGGTTSGACNSVNGDYSGCNRTVCDWKAANEACSKLRYQGLTWRLPTSTELTALGSRIYEYSAGKGNGGLMLCGGDDAYNVNGSSSQCSYHNTNCQGAAEADCDVGYLWTSTSYKYFQFSGNVLTGPQGDGKNWAKSVRCVAPFVNCSAGKYNESGVCTDCDKKVANCTDCNKYTGECLACREGFELKNGACVSSACGALAMQVKLGGKDMCMTKYNLGPDALQAGMAAYGAGNFGLPNTVTTAIAGVGSCDTDSKKCCWVGMTSDTCDKANGRYSGCSRTVCNWAGANEACTKLSYLGKTWRLPTSTELTNLGEQIEVLSKSQGDNGLMLCSDTASDKLSAKCGWATRCPSARPHYCYPYSHWGTSASSTTAYSVDFHGPKLDSVETTDKGYALGFRCVSEL